MTPPHDRMPPRGWGWSVWGLMLVALALTRHWMEARMVLHMGLQFPALFFLGWWAWRREPRALAAINAHGLLTLSVVLTVSALWMIPTALDLALMSPTLALFKALSWMLAGALVRHAWPRMALELRGFMLGNVAWMFISVGMLYQTLERRLCVNYLVDDQSLTGRLLVVFGGVLGAWATWMVFRAAQTDPSDEADRR